MNPNNTSATTRSVIACIIIGAQLAGCRGKTSTKEKTAFARIYAEMLVAENMYRNDTTRQRQVMDSILHETEFESREEVRAWLEELTISDPEGVQEVMDSTQKYLELVRDTGTGN